MNNEEKVNIIGVSMSDTCLIGMLYLLVQERYRHDNKTRIMKADDVESWSERAYVSLMLSEMIFKKQGYKTMREVGDVIEKFVRESMVAMATMELHETSPEDMHQA